MMFLMLSSGLLYLFYHNKNDYTSTFFAFDTVVSVRSDSDICEEIKNEFTGLDSILDCYDDNSELSVLNREKEAPCSEKITLLLENTAELNRTFGYGIDISAGKLTALWHDSLEKGRLPDDRKIKELLEVTGRENYTVNGNMVTLKNDVCIDPGAVAKGYALDRIVNIVKEKAPDHAIVSTGSSTLLYSSDTERVFSVAVKADREHIAGTAKVKQCFVSTSGDYERSTEIGGKAFNHIIDLKTGYPADGGLSSVTVFCDSGIKSDFLSTLIFAEGTEELSQHLESDDYLVLAIDKKGNILKSDTLEFFPAADHCDSVSK